MLERRHMKTFGLPGVWGNTPPGTADFHPFQANPDDVIMTVRIWIFVVENGVTLDNKSRGIPIVFVHSQNETIHKECNFPMETNTDSNRPTKIPHRTSTTIPRKRISNTCHPAAQLAHKKTMQPTDAGFAVATSQKKHHDERRRPIYIGGT